MTQTTARISVLSSLIAQEANRIAASIEPAGATPPPPPVTQAVTQPEADEPQGPADSHPPVTPQMPRQ
jgi:hypothetical protein